MVLKWDEATFGCGHAVVDQQHKQLFAMVNKLSEVMSSGSTKELPAMMEFLKNYVVTHFAQEEGVMARCRCPKAEDNKRAHAEFLKAFTTLYTQYQAGGHDLTILMKIHHLAVSWLTSHIMKVDTSLKASAQTAA
jgi:hemerythrin-like metal-binding protein